MWNIPALNPMTNAPNNTVHGSVRLVRPATIGQTTAYSVTFTVPDGVYLMQVSAIGGGGGGDGSAILGSPGICAMYMPINVVPGQAILCVIGAGGGTSTNGTATSIGNYLTLSGGVGDGGGTAASWNQITPFTALSQFNNAADTGGGTTTSGRAGIAVFTW